MRINRWLSWFGSLLLVTSAAVALQTAGNTTRVASGSSEVLVVRGAKIYPVGGPPIGRGVLMIRDNKIEAVGAEVLVTGKVSYQRQPDAK